MWIDFDILTVIIFTFVFAIIVCARKWYRDIPRLTFQVLMFVYLTILSSYTVFPIVIGGHEDMGQTLDMVVNLKLFEYGFQTTDYLNVIMTIPFGFLLSFLVKFNWKKMIIANALVGIVIEGVQLITFLIVGFTFRSVDVNDLVCNFAGAMVGMFIFLVFAKIYNKLFGGKKLNSFFGYIYEMTK